MPKSFMNCKCGFWLAFVLPVVLLYSGGLSADPHKSCYRKLISGGGRDGFTFESDPKKPSVPIVVTLGPGTAYREKLQIQPLEPAVLRMNFSHVGTDPKRWGDANNILRTVWPFGSAILADNPGPKIRITNSQQIALHTGISLAINRDGTSPAEENRQDLRNLLMSVQEFDWITENLRVDSPIVIGDDVEGIVTDFKPNRSFTVKITSLPKIGYVLTGNKGIQAPGVEVNAPALTPLDFKNTDWLIWTGQIHGITISFIRDGSDVVQLRSYMTEILGTVFNKIRQAESFSEIEKDSSADGKRTLDFINNVAYRAKLDEMEPSERFKIIKEGVLRHHGTMPMIWAKVETVTALDNLEEIVTELSRVGGGLIVARGDLQIQTRRDLAAAEVLLVASAKRAGLPVVVATGGFATPSVQSALTPSDTVDVGLTALLQAGLMVSEPTAMAADDQRLRDVIRHMKYVASQAYDLGGKLQVGLSLDSLADFRIDPSALPDREIMDQARRIVEKKNLGKNDSLGRVPVVFEGVPSLRLIQAIRILDWGLPLLVVDENCNNLATETDRGHSGREFLQRVLKFYPFVSLVSAGSPLSSEKDFAAVLVKQTWAGAGDEFILVREKDGEGQQHKQQVEPVLIRVN